MRLIAGAVPSVHTAASSDAPSAAVSSDFACTANIFVIHCPAVVL